MKKNKPLILITNDDGYNSNGISTLINVASKIGDIYVMAPDKNRSAVSHSITIHEEISFEMIDKQKFKCSGTPVDCVKLALDKILPSKPDLCLSGINHGSNHSINTVYSGTLHGAMEGTIHGINSISFSHLSYDDEKKLDGYEYFIKKIIEDVLTFGLPDNLTLNINIPDVHENLIKGIKICNQSQGLWKEDYKFNYVKNGKKFYTVTGDFIEDDTNIDGDSWALKNNFISAVAVKIDCSYPKAISKIKFLEKCD